MQSNNLLLIGGGVLALYIYSKSQAAATTALTPQQQAQYQARQQALQQQGTQSYIRQGTSLLQSLFGTGTRGGIQNNGYGNSQAGNPYAGGYFPAQTQYTAPPGTPGGYMQQIASYSLQNYTG